MAANTWKHQANGDNGSSDAGFVESPLHILA